MTLLLFFYCLAIATASWVGGWLPTGVRLGHRQTQMVLSGVSGVMLGVAMLSLLPHSIRLLNDEAYALAICLGGLLFMFFMVRMFPFHDHDSPAAHGEAHHCEHDEHQHEIRREDASWLGLALGFSIHTLIDGIALAAAVQAPQHMSGTLAGLGVFAAILFHKPLDAMTITSLMAVRGWSPARRGWVNLVFALLCPLGAFLCATGVAVLGDNAQWFFGCALAFSSGVFLCISLGDLLPEVQFHSHDRLALSGALLLGLGVAIAIQLLA